MSVRQNTLFQGGAEKASGKPSGRGGGGEDRGDAKVKCPRGLQEICDRSTQRFHCSIYEMLGQGTRIATMMLIERDMAMALSLAICD
jgi:hypothetical protein